MSANTSQAARIIKKFGGARRLAPLIGKDPSAVYKWDYPLAKGGTGGIIPTRMQAKVRDAADLLGIELTSEDWKP